MCHPSVSCIIYNTDIDCIILVKQFRPVVYFNKLIEVHENFENPESIKSKSFDNLEWHKINPQEGRIKKTMF
jgi:hypothetical protein